MDRETGASANYEGDSLYSSKILEQEETDGSRKEYIISHDFDSSKEMGVEMSIGSPKDYTIEVDLGSNKDATSEKSLGSLKETLREYTNNSGKESFKERSSGSLKESSREISDDSRKESQRENLYDSSRKESIKEVSSSSGKEEIQDGKTLTSGKEEMLDQMSLTSGKEEMLENRSSNSGKEEMIDRTGSSSGKEEIRDNQSTSSGKEELLEHYTLSSGKESIRIISNGSSKEIMLEIDLDSDKEEAKDNTRDSKDSEKEGFKDKASLDSLKESLNEFTDGSDKDNSRIHPPGIRYNDSSKQSLYYHEGSSSRKESMRSDDLTFSRKEEKKDTSFGSEKELMDIKITDNSSSKEEMRSRENTSSLKEEKKDSDSIDSHKEVILEEQSIDSSKDELLEVTLKTGSEKDYPGEGISLSGSGKEGIRLKSFGSGSAKEDYGNHSTISGSGKERYHERTLMSGSDKERFHNKSTISGSGKEGYMNRTIMTGSGKEHHGGNSIISGSEKEMHRGFSLVSGSDKEYHRGISFNSGSGKEYHGMNSLASGSGKEIHEGRSFISGSGKEHHRGQSLISGSGKELHEGRSFLSGSGKEHHRADSFISGSGKEFHHDKSMLSGSGKELQGDRSLISGSGKELQRDLTLLSGSDKERYYNRSNISGSGKERYQNQSQISGSGKDLYLHNPSMISGSNKESYQNKSMISGSGKEGYADRSYNSGSDKEFMERHSMKSGSGKEFEPYRSSLNSGSDKERFMNKSVISGSGKEHYQGRSDFSGSGKERLEKPSLISLAGSDKELQKDLSMFSGSGKERFLNQSILSGSGKEQFRDRSILSGSDKEKVKNISSVSSSIKDHYPERSLGSGSMKEEYKEEYHEKSDHSDSAKELMTITFRSGSEKEELSVKDSISGSGKEILADVPSQTDSSKLIFGDDSEKISAKQSLPDITEEGSSKEFAREKSSIGSEKELYQDPDSFDSSQKELIDSAKVSSQKDDFMEASSLGSQKEYIVEKSSIGSSKEYFREESKHSSKDEEIHLRESDFSSSQKEQPQDSNSQNSRKEIPDEPTSEDAEGSSKERIIAIEMESSKDDIPLPEGEEMELISSSDIDPLSGMESSLKETLPSQAEQDSYNSSKEDLMMGKEPTDDSLDSVKELAPAEDGSVEEPQQREFRDVAIGMSVCDISNKESEGDEDSLKVHPSPNPVVDSSGEEKSLGSSKETHHIIIREEYIPSSIRGSSKEEEDVREYTSGSNKESLKEASDRIIEIDINSRSGTGQVVVTEKSDGSSKERLRPISDQVRLKNYSEYTNGSSKERYISEQIEESDHMSEVTVGSEKEVEREKSSKGSAKELLPKPYIEVSSLGSAKEEIMVQSIGSSKEEPQPSNGEVELTFRESDRQPSQISKEISSLPSSEKELLKVEASDKSSKLPSIVEMTSGSAKESFQTLDSYCSSKEGMVEEDPSEDADIPSLDRISSSDKELEGDNTISEIRLREDPNHPERGYIDKRSFGNSSGELAEISSNAESEMNSEDRTNSSRRPGINFYNLSHSYNDSEKEEVMEYSDGSSKEELIENIRSMRDKSSREILSKRTEEVEAGESSKEILRSQILPNKFLTELSSPLAEETSEEERSYKSKVESLSSHCDQISSSEQEATPKNAQPYLDDRIRNNVLRMNAVLKKTPSSMAMLARNFINSNKNGLRASQGLPPKDMNRQNLHDYGKPSSKYSTESRPEAAPAMYRSLESPLDRPEIKDNGYFNEDSKSNDYGRPTPESSDRDKELMGGIPVRPSIDWFTTPVYKEYQDEGITKYNSSGHQMFFDEEEVTGIYNLLKTRYSNTRTNKKIEEFFKKAMDTLAEILGSFLLNNVYRAIRKIYSRSDVQNTMKLILRVKALIKARYILFQVFQDIHDFSKHSERLEILLQSNKQLNITRTYSQIRETMKDLTSVHNSLQNSFELLKIDHPQVCKDRFNFKRVEWVSHSRAVFTKISEEVAQQGISFEDKRLKY